MYKISEYSKTCKYFGEIFTKSIKIETYDIKVSHFYDKDHEGYRYSYEVCYPGGTVANGGYGDKNEIVYSTFDIAFDAALRSIWHNDIEKYREVKLNLILIKET